MFVWHVLTSAIKLLNQYYHHEGGHHLNNLLKLLKTVLLICDNESIIYQQDDTLSHNVFQTFSELSIKNFQQNGTIIRSNATELFFLESCKRICL